LNACQHAIAGAAVGIISAIMPDIILVSFGLREEWLPESHLLVRSHRFLHDHRGVLLIVVLAWASHVVIDRFSEHRMEQRV